MGIYFIALAILLFGAFFSIFVNENWKMKLCSIFLAFSAVLISIPSLKVLFTGRNLFTSLYLSPILGEINFVIDPISAFFIIIISFMSLIGTIYASGYIESYLHKNMNISSHCMFLMLLITSMILVVSVQNALFFLIVWEIMSLSSFFLVIFENEKQSVLNAGMKYLIYMHISILFLISAFAIMNIKTGSFNFIEFAHFLIENPQTGNLVFLLSFIGFGIKAGFVPFHNWLPEAHPAAPSHISGIMSGVMIKTGIYGILRIIYLIGLESKFIAYTVLTISIISALWGVLYAISKHDIKELLAYHSIENIGIIGIGIGTGLLGMAYNNTLVGAFGFAGALFHILNHSIFKELLFFASGAIYKKTHTRDIELLGGLIKNMPHTSLFFIIGAVAISGLPPFNGFISEFLIYAAALMGLNSNNIALFMFLIITISSLALVGTMAILCFTKVTGVMLLGNPRSENARNTQSDVESIMILPMGILAILTFVIGIFPQNILFILLSPVAMFVKVPQDLDILIQITQLLSFIFLIFMVITISISLLRIFADKYSRIYTTWGCGYNKPSSRFQYTASSYADLFISTLKPMFKRIEHIKKPKGLFPKEAYYDVETQDIEETYIIKPLIKLDERFLSKFERIQNGNMQQYILFGLIFLILSIAGLIYFG